MLDVSYNESLKAIKKPPDNEKNQSAKSNMISSS